MTHKNYAIIFMLMKCKKYETGEQTFKQTSRLQYQRETVRGKLV